LDPFPRDVEHWRDRAISRRRQEREWQACIDGAIPRRGTPADPPREDRLQRQPDALRQESIITPEMEYIAIRENIGREKALEHAPKGRRAERTRVITSVLRYRNLSLQNSSAMRSRAAEPSSRRTSTIRSRADDHRP